MYIFPYSFYTDIRIRIRLIKAKQKAIPLQDWTGLKGSRMLRFPDFKTIGT
jgi:hypothetical protein